jgi:hypothetical protein
MAQNPNSIVVVVGTDVSSDHKDTYHDDTNICEVTELTQTPGFTVDFYFDKFVVTNYLANFLKLYIRGWYNGNPAHNVKVYVYNWITESWDDFAHEPADPDADMPDEAAEVEYTIYGKPNGGWQDSINGTIILRINHDSTGSAGHDLYINEMTLEAVTFGNIDGSGQN